MHARTIVEAHDHTPITIHYYLHSGLKRQPLTTLGTTTTLSANSMIQSVELRAATEGTDNKAELHATAGVLLQHYDDLSVR